MRWLPLLLLTGLPLAASEPKFTAEQVAFYENDVKPLLKKHCLRCHGQDENKVKAELRLTTRAAVLKGGESGPAVNLDKPEESLLLLAITNRRPDGAEAMPPSGQLPDAEIAIFKRWVMEKLPVTTADLGSVAEHRHDVITEESKKFWAYQPVRKPPVPVNGAATAIDAFLKERLDAKGLTPNGPADKTALVRRLYYDLIGLPPTPEQVDRFLEDRSANAYETLIDELLASPHYGEKWGRHWLDVVRYAETNGYERDGPKPNVWKFRDYVIRSFNDDKPYDQFLREQLAGDELPWSADARIATGFYRLGLWDDEPADEALALYDSLDDYVTTVGQGMLGMSLNCARCHDHKRDPIRHSDYYRFAAFFRDIPMFSESRNVFSRQSQIDVTPPDKRAIYEKDLEEKRTKMDAIRAQMTPIEDAAIKKMPPKDQLAVQDGKRAEVVARVPAMLEGKTRETYENLRRQLRELERQPVASQEFALGVTRCLTKPPPVHVLARGNPHAPKELCVPGFPAVLGVPDPAITPLPKSSGRRSALADWITAKANPLTARVFVNRLWQHHFGRGIVGTPNDFGKLGELPTHPELLDWLAADFVEHGWKIKRMHRLLLNTEAYRRSSRGDDANLRTDPTNSLYWRFNMRRLGAEEVRDSMLAVAGKLDPRLFGKSVYPRIPDEVLAGQSRPGEGWTKPMGGGYDPKKPDEGNRRTIYVHIKRSLQLPILATHDQADTDASCPVRYTTTVPTQALGLLNGEFTHEMATAMAKRLTRQSAKLAEQVALAIRLTTGRVPTAHEVNQDVAFVTRLESTAKLERSVALQRYALLMLNANEFVYLD